ncbi:MAG: helix-turn-helix domain-containing protein [Anaerolineae bacterium]|nr:helix-turn-helix domain-containing protein [Anaerolineae bacterium]
MSRWRVHELRKAIEENPKNPKYIITVRGQGYRLVT